MIETLHIDRENVDTLKVSDQLTDEQRAATHELLCDYGSLFAHSLQELRETESLQMRIEVKKDAVPYCPKAARRLSPKERDAVQKKVTELLEAGLIQEDDSEWGSQCVLAPKKGNDQLRMCHNYIPLNRRSVTNRPGPDRTGSEKPVWSGPTCPWTG
ncbi:MAG: hypothetical protein Aurels2KO_58450 [Aureliella sp.]